jgi:hypothetical protein
MIIAMNNMSKQKSCCSDNRASVVYGLVQVNLSEVHGQILWDRHPPAL